MLSNYASLIEKPWMRWSSISILLVICYFLLNSVSGYRLEQNKFGNGLFSKSNFLSESALTQHPAFIQTENQYNHWLITQDLSKNKDLLNYKTLILNPGASTNFNGVYRSEVEFPIIHFLISIATSDPVLQLKYWRLANYYFYFACAILLFLIARILIKNYIINILISLSLLFIPIFSIQPYTITPYSFNFFLIFSGIYFMTNYQSKNNQSHHFIGISIVGIACLINFFFLPILISYLISEIVKKIYTNDQINRFSFVVYSVFIIGSIATFTKLQMSSQALNSYVSIFNSKVKFSNYLQSFFEKQIGSLISPFWALILMGVISIFVIDILRRTWFWTPKKIWFCFWIISGVILIILFFPSISTNLILLSYITLPLSYLLIVYSSKYLDEKIKNAKWILFFNGMICFIVSISTSHGIFYSMYNKQSEELRKLGIDKLLTGQKILDSLEIPEDEPIAFLDREITNSHLYSLGKKAFVLKNYDPKTIENMLKNCPSKYYVTEDKNFFNNIITNYPDVLNYLDLLKNNDTIAIYKKLDVPRNNGREVLEFYLQSHLISNTFKLSKSFEERDSIPKTGYWVIPSETEESNVTQNIFLKVQPLDRFPITFECVLNELPLKPKGLIVSALINATEELDSVCFNISSHPAPDYQSQTYIQIKNIKNNYPKQFYGEWQRIFCKLPFPTSIPNSERLKVYIFNPNKKRFMVDNFEFIIY